jgi:hypothetical protein
MSEADTNGTDAPLTKLADATLDGVHGVGVLQRVHGQDVSILIARGTWHVPHGENPAKTFSEQDVGREVAYEGPLFDDLSSVYKEVQLSVKITSVGTYERTPRLGQDDEGEPYPQTVVNFEPVSNQWRDA